jgi:hypothetical protein
MTHVLTSDLLPTKQAKRSSYVTDDVNTKNRSRTRAGEFGLQQSLLTGSYSINLFDGFLDTSAIEQYCFTKLYVLQVIKQHNII